MLGVYAALHTGRYVSWYNVSSLKKKKQKTEQAAWMPPTYPQGMRVCLKCATRRVYSVGSFRSTRQEVRGVCVQYLGRYGNSRSGCQEVSLVFLWPWCSSIAPITPDMSDRRWACRVEPSSLRRAVLGVLLAACVYGQYLGLSDDFRRSVPCCDL